MVSITLAIDELKSQLVEIVRGSLEKGFELVAGYAGSKIAKSVEGTLKDVAKAGAAAASGVTIVATGQVSLIGLREQIKDNAAILFPLLNHATTAIHIITTGMPDTGGIRAVLLDGTANPPCVLTSKKFPTVIAAMQDLLDLTQTHLKFRNAVLYGGNASPNFACDSFAPGMFDRTAPSAKESAASPWTSFDTVADESYESFTSRNGLSVNCGSDTNYHGGHGTATAKKTPELDRKDSVTDDQLRWDPNVTTNPHFGGFDYASFEKRDTSGEPTQKRYEYEGETTGYGRERTAVDPWA